MGMDPNQLTVDPLNQPSRSFADSLFATLGQGMQTGRPNNFNASQAPAFQQLFGTSPNRGPLASGPSNGGGNPGGVPSSGTRMAQSMSGGNFQNTPTGSPPAFDPFGMSNGNLNSGGGGVPIGGMQPFQGFNPGGQGGGLTMDPGAGGGGASPPQSIDFSRRDGESIGDYFGRVQETAPSIFAGLNPAQPFAGGIDSFNMPMWDGPYGAGMTGGQMDALSGINQLMNGNPLVSNEMIQGGLQTGLGGNPAFDPANGGTLEGAVQPYELPTQSGGFFDQLFGEGGFLGGDVASGGGSRLNDVISEIQPDLVDSFRGALNPGGAGTGQGQAAMDGAINLALARANEQASGMGLTPGSIDRASLMAGEAADVAAKLGIEQQAADTQSISRRNQDRVGGLNAAGSFGNLLNSDVRNRLAGGQLGVSALPALLQQENSAFDRMMGIHEPAAGRSMQALSMLPEFRNIPMQELTQIFGVNEAARGTADDQIARMMAEFGRTQGGMFDRGVGALGAIPGINTAMGPSDFSQIAGAGGGIGQVVAGLK